MTSCPILNMLHPNIDEGLLRKIIREELSSLQKQSDTTPTSYLLTVGQAAEYVGVQSSTIREWVKRGKLPASKAGKGWRIRRGDLDRSLASKEATVPPEEFATDIIRLERRKR